MVKEPDMTRRWLCGALGAAAAITAVDGLGAIVLATPAQAARFSMPSDSDIADYLNMPVDEILAGVDHIPVDDTNYHQEVYQERFPIGSRAPVVSLFYANEGKFSKGVAVLAKTIIENYPDFKMVAYKAADGASVPNAKHAQIKEDYLIGQVPTMLMMGNGRGVIETLQGYTQGGIGDAKYLKDKIGAFLPYIGKDMSFKFD